MQQYKLYIVLFTFVCFNFISCSDFLKEESSNQVKPITVEDFKQLLIGEVYPLTDDMYPLLDYLTDDVQNKYPTDNYGLASVNKYKYFFTWNQDMHVLAKQEGANNYNHYKFFYEKIMGCNVILESIDNAVGDNNERGNVKGQALTMRAFYYLNLVNIYGMPYTMGEPHTDLGVPIILHPDVSDKLLSRATVQEVYNRIITDLKAAEVLMEKYGQGNLMYKASYKLVLALMARVYLYMGDWNKSLAYSDILIKKYPELQKLKAINPYNKDYSSNVYAQNSPEIIWAVGESIREKGKHPDFPYTSNPSGDETIIAWSVADEVMNLYTKDNNNVVDYRKDSYIFSALTGYYFDEITFEFTYIYSNAYASKSDKVKSPNEGVRMSEIYLNYAEANIQLAKENKGGDLNKAMWALNKLRSHRFADGYSDVTLTDINEIWEFYQEERRRELIHECGHRWFDIRRWGIVGFVHKTEFTKGEYSEYIFDNKNKYALPIPADVIERNPAIVQNKY